MLCGTVFHNQQVATITNKKQHKTKLENVAIAMHCNLRLSDAEPVVLRFNYDNIPRLKSVSFLMLIRF